MRFTVRGRNIDVEPQPFILSSLILGWASFYFFSTLQQPDVGPKSVLFIKPLVLLLGISYVFVIFSCLKISPAVEKPGMEEAQKKDISRDYRRFVFVLSLVVYAAAITFFGYLIPSVLFMSFVCYYLGLRKVWLLALLAIGVPLVLSVVFKYILGIPLPILPSWELLM